VTSEPREITLQAATDEGVHGALAPVLPVCGIIPLNHPTPKFGIIQFTKGLFRIRMGVVSHFSSLIEQISHFLCFGWSKSSQVADCKYISWWDKPAMVGGACA
jgi:hypothetical protein